jgi:hypothetical protein
VGVLQSYRKAIRAMLALPPTDPRNWYRQALIHTLDCPHGNWWFLPWHRAYLGWFEQICRELSGDSTFAIPYWDWTEATPGTPFKPGIPLAMFDDVLTPTNAAFIAAYGEFERNFKSVFAGETYWRRMNPWDPVAGRNTQYGQLLQRGIRFNEDLWFDIHDDPRGQFFFDLALARGLTSTEPWFDAETARLVGRDNLLATLAPTNFIGFGSAKAPNHGAGRGSGPLESGPHNNVHNNTAGFMQDLMSPVDPIFFLHHANIDRLWDVWTRKQVKRGYTTLPDGYLAPNPVKGTDYFAWANEPFLFFVDAQGRAVTKTKAGDYADSALFDYAYQPGSGEEVVNLSQLTRQAPPAAAPAPTVLNGKLTRRNTGGSGALATVSVPVAARRALSSAAPGAVLAKITVEPSSSGHAGLHLRVYVNGPDSGDPGPESPYYAGSYRPFGHRQMTDQVTFTVPLSPALAGLERRNLLDARGSLTIRIVSVVDPAHRTADMTSDAEVTSIQVEIY